MEIYKDLSNPTSQAPPEHRGLTDPERALQWACQGHLP